MMFKLAAVLLSLSTLGLSAAPKLPTLTYLCTFVNSFSSTPPIIISPTRQGILITNGTFSGPKLNGKLAGVGSEFYEVDNKGGLTSHPMYAITTNDGANILVRGEGHAPIEYISFETGSEKYAWLNYVVAVAQVSLTPDGKAVAVDVWQVNAS